MTSIAREPVQIGRVDDRNQTEAEMPLLFFLPIIIASGLLPVPPTVKPVQNDD